MKVVISKKAYETLKICAENHNLSISEIIIYYLPEATGEMEDRP